MTYLKLTIKKLTLLFFYLVISNIVFAEKDSHQCNYDKSNCCANSIIDKKHDAYQEIITPENDLITGFLVVIKNHNLEESMSLIEDSYSNYFNNQKINFKNIETTEDTTIFYLTKDAKDQNFYANFSKVVFWLMLNRRNSSVTIKPIVSNQHITNDRVIFFDKPLCACDNTANNFLDFENTIIDSYHIQVDFLADQQERAKLLFNQFQDYISKQRLIYSNLNLCIEDSNSSNISYRWKIEFNKVGTQLMHDYGKSLIWLLLNHGDIFLNSSAKFSLFDKNSNCLISLPNTCLYGGKKTEFNQEFVNTSEGVNSNLVSYNNLLPNVTSVTEQDSKLKQQEVLDFWFNPEMKPKWFKRQHEPVNSLDKLIKRKFHNDLFLLVNGYYVSWLESLEGKLAYIIMTDQFPRNMYRGTPMILAYDKLALKVAKSIIEVGNDKKLNIYERIFCYLPLTHSEDASDQQQAVELFTNLLQDVPKHLVEDFDFRYQKILAHKIIIDNFGRFLHRDKTLFDLKLTPEEINFIEKHDATF